MLAKGNLKKASRMEKSTSQDRGKSKLLDGPCSEVYKLLGKCAMEKGIDVNNMKMKLEACPSETDGLIKCMNKNPKYFFS